MSQSASETFNIVNELGLHARAAAAFVKTAGRFKSQINVTKDTVTVNGKSIMGVLMLAASKGTAITIEASGGDAEEALKELGALIKNKFGEEK